MNSDPSYNLSNLNSIRFQNFNIHQYYNAVEDERTYMNEYTSLIYRYTDFLIQGNAMFTRMEHTIRENLSRAVVRQSFYFNHLLHRLTTPNLNSERVAQLPIRVLGGGTTMADLLLRYLGGREFIHSSGASGGEGAAGSGRPSSLPIGPPTNDQIARATLNTFFSNILSPVNATCPISQDEFNDESEITMIRGCNHIFNRTSLRNWFVNHSTCPMCRNDIRLYRPPTSEAEQPAVSTSVPPRHTNLSIDSVDDNHVTFSYDLPRHYTNEQIYQHIVNTISGLAESEENDNDAENLD